MFIVIYEITISIDVRYMDLLLLIHDIGHASLTMMCICNFKI